MRLKRWESPRREGRNDKGKGGSARKRQLKKQRQMLRQKLKDSNKTNDGNNYGKGEDKNLPPLFLALSIHTPFSCDLHCMALHSEIFTKI